MVKSPLALMKQVGLPDIAKPQNKYAACPPEWVRRMMGLQSRINSKKEERQSHATVPNWAKPELLRKQSRADAASPKIPPYEVLVALFEKNGNVGKCPGPAVVVIDP